MNQIESKVAELVELASSYGIETVVETRPNHSVITYKTISAFTSYITLTEKTKKARVESWCRSGRAYEKVAQADLPEWLGYEKERLAKFAERRAKRA